MYAIRSYYVLNQSGGVDFFTDIQSRNISLNNLRIGGSNGANLSAVNVSGSFSFNTPPTPPDATGSFVSLNEYVNITRENSGVFDSLSLNRITSYNVCYTKLLRVPPDSEQAGMFQLYLLLCL